MSTTEESPIKVRTVYVLNAKTGVRYEEKREYRYDPVKKQNVLLSSRRTGNKILPGEDNAVPCRPKKKRQTETVAETRVGASELISLAGRASGLEAAVRTAFPRGETADKLLSTAQFMAITGNTVDNIDAWQCSHDLPCQSGMSEDICHDLLEDLGRDESGIQCLFRRLASLDGAPDKRPCIAFDTTGSSCSRNPWPYTSQEFGEDGDSLDAYKLTTFVSAKSGLPIYFDLHLGNIPDVGSLFDAISRIKTYGLSSPELVLDNGFFSRGNICHFLRQNVKFTILASLGDKWIYDPFDSEVDGKRLRDDLDLVANACPFEDGLWAVSTCMMTEFGWTRERTRGENAAGSEERKSFRLYYHYYYNSARALEMKSRFMNKVLRIQKDLGNGVKLPEHDQAFADRYFTCKTVKGGKIRVTANDAAIREAQKDFGVFALLSSRHKDPWEALKTYRKRNVIEDSYPVVKSEPDGRRGIVWTMDCIRGKEVCRLVALGYKFVLQDAMNWTRTEAEARSSDEENYTKEQRAMYKLVADWSNANTLDQVLAWLDCIKDVTVTNACAQRRWTAESVNRDRAFVELISEKLVG